MSTALAEIRSAPGLDAYLDALESRLERAVEAYPGVVAAVGKESLAAGGKRLRPLLVFLSSPDAANASLAGGVAVELLHMATLVHDDLIDGAEVRRGRASVWSAHGEGVARAAGDYLFARAFGELAAAGDLRAVQVLADAALALVRGETMQRRQQHDPNTSVDAYLERCALKTATLFEASCLLGGGEHLRAFGVEPRHRVPDRRRHPRLHRRDDRDRQGRRHRPPRRNADAAAHPRRAGRRRRSRRARRRTAGGRARARRRERRLERSREVALDYAERARASLDGKPYRKELDALITAVLERRS